MRKPALCIFLWPFYSDMGGGSNKHCFLPFFHFSLFEDI